jgi:hypothetical protein
MNCDELAEYLASRYPVDDGVVPKERFFLAAFPKSGGTFLARVFANLIGGETSFGGLVPGRNEQDLAAPALWQTRHEKIVFHQHARFSFQGHVFCEHFKLRPAVCVRNLADVVPSVIDHLRQNRMPSGGANWPFAYVSDDILKLSDEDMAEFVVTHILPWYVNFFVSWMKDTQAPMISYEQIFSRDRSALYSFFSGFGFEAEQVDGAISRAGKESTRLNVGKVGRGSALSDDARRKIERLLSFYPEVDFSPIWRGQDGARSRRFWIARPLRRAQVVL